MNKNMKTEYQSLDWAIPIINQQLKVSTRSKISTIFRILRNHPRFTLFGDYPLFSIVIKEMIKHNLKITKPMIRKSLKVSIELKNRETLVSTLFNG